MSLSKIIFSPKSISLFRMICLVTILIGSISPGFSNRVSESKSFEPKLIGEPSFLLQAEQSTFQQSCRNIRVNGNTLSADCKREKGRYRSSSIQIRGIHNNNGSLEFFSDRRGRSTFQETCTNIRMDGATLIARCQRENGSARRTSIVVWGIRNDDGRLSYF